MTITFLLAEDNYKHAATVAGYVDAVADEVGIPVNIVKAFRQAEVMKKIEEFRGQSELIIIFDLQLERGEMVRIDDEVFQLFSPKSKGNPGEWAITVPIIVFSVFADEFGVRLKGRANTFVVPKIPRTGSRYDALKSAIRDTLQIVMNQQS